MQGGLLHFDPDNAAGLKLQEHFAGASRPYDAKLDNHAAFFSTPVLWPVCRHIEALPHLRSPGQQGWARATAPEATSATALHWKRDAQLAFCRRVPASSSRCGATADGHALSSWARRQRVGPWRPLCRPRRRCSSLARLDASGSIGGGAGGACTRGCRFETKARVRGRVAGCGSVGEWGPARWPARLRSAPKVYRKGLGVSCVNWFGIHIQGCSFQGCMYLRNGPEVPQQFVCGHDFNVYVRSWQSRSLGPPPQGLALPGTIFSCTPRQQGAFDLAGSEGGYLC